MALPDNVASPEAANVENAPVLAEFAPIGVPSIAPLSILILVVAYPPKSETPSISNDQSISTTQSNSASLLNSILSAPFVESNDT